jgi:radical SAM superfamily enzyme YgiQ (UPF0313 family)
MALAGFKLVFIGIENVLIRNLELFNKTNMAANTQEAVKNLHEYGIIIAGGLILGNPDDTKEDIWANYKIAREYHLDSPIFYLLTPYPKTVLREELIEKGLVTNVDEYEKYTGLHANVRTEHMSSEELQREVWQMAAHFYSGDWLKYTIIKKVYPLWFYRKALSILPNVIKRKMGVKLGLVTEDELFRRDMERGVLYRHVKI